MSDLPMSVVCAVPQWCLTLFNPMDCAHQAPLAMGFSKQEYWSGLPCPPLEDLPNPGIKHLSPVSPSLQADLLPPEPPEETFNYIEI